MYKLTNMSLQLQASWEHTEDMKTWRHVMPAVVETSGVQLSSHIQQYVKYIYSTNRLLVTQLHYYFSHLPACRKAQRCECEWEEKAAERLMGSGFHADCNEWCRFAICGLVGAQIWSDRVSLETKATVTTQSFMKANTKLSCGRSKIHSNMLTITLPKITILHWQTTLTLTELSHVCL